MTRRFWSPAEIAAITDAYQRAENSEALNVAGLAEQIGRSYNSVVLKAGRLGLTDIKRKGVAVRKDAPKHATLEARRAAMSNAARARIERDGHPRHMLGKTHSEETRTRLSVASRAVWSSRTEAERRRHIDKVVRSKALSPGGYNGSTAHGSWKAGWREVGGKRNYYRSRWEANYARYLEWLKARGEIEDWQHEPETFWFDAIKRGVRSYLPDFRVWENDGSTPLHEVKGWMDARSKTTLRRMAKYHPQERIVVIREKAYNEIARKVGPMIDGWESGGRADRP